MSFDTNPIVAAKTAVMPPTIATTAIAEGEESNMGKNLPTKKTPAATIVAACMSALTGVGPSMASGSHVCKGNCPDFPTAPTNMPTAISVRAPELINPVCTRIGKCSFIVLISK